MVARLCPLGVNFSPRGWRNKSGRCFVGWGKDSNDQSGGSELFRAKLYQKERVARL